MTQEMEEGTNYVDLETARISVPITDYLDRADDQIRHLTELVDLISAERDGLKRDRDDALAIMAERADALEARDAECLKLRAELTERAAALDAADSVRQSMRNEIERLSGLLFSRDGGGGS